MFDFLGGLISAGASLFGGSQNVSAQESIASQNIAEQNFLSSGGNLPALVQNAKKAGINPLAALGYSGGTAPSNSISGAGSGVANAGQDISRAMSAYMDHNMQKEQQQIELMKAQTDKTRADAVATLDTAMARHYGVPGSPPPLNHVAGFHPGREHFISRIHPTRAYGYAKMPDGSIMLVPTKEFSQQTMTTAAFGPSHVGGLSSIFPVSESNYDRLQRDSAWSLPHVPPSYEFPQE